MDLEQILTFVIPDPDDCRRAARELRLENPDATAEQAAELAVKQSRKWAVSIGATTGAFASPISMLPAAFADAVAMMKLEGKLAGTIAALLDPESLSDPAAFRRDIFRSVFPGAVSQTLRKMGVRAAEASAKSAVRRITTHAATKELTERATKSLGVRLTEKALASKTVPLVGAGIGAAWNYAEVHAIGRRAIDYHLGRETPEHRIGRKLTTLAKDLPNRLRRTKGKDRPEGFRDVY